MKKRLLLTTIPLVLGLIGCGDGTSSGGQDEIVGSIDLRSYFPIESTTKNYKVISKEIGGTEKEEDLTEEILVDDSKIETKIFGVTDNILTVQDNRLVYTNVSADGNISTVLYRYVDVGGVIYSKDISEVEKIELNGEEIGEKSITGTKECILEEELNEFSKDSYIYNGNIIKIKCTNRATVTTKIKDEYLGLSEYVNGTEDFVDIDYRYLLNGTGSIALIDSDCIPEGMKYPDDTVTNCPLEHLKYRYIYYLE